MRFLSTKVHGFLDYAMGLLLIAAPWLFGFARGGAETWLPVGIGIAALLYSLLTDYELGVARVISMPAHLWLDALSGVLLAASPWLFGFAQLVWVPHLILGLAELSASLVTRTVPQDRTASRAHTS